jgi:hypothetical protein
MRLSWDVVAQRRQPGDPTLPAEQGTVADSPRAKQPRREVTRGSQLGRYIVLEEVGSGGMGVVYAAYDPDLHRRVAVKLLHPEITQAGQSSGRARLLREAQAMARVSHPNVIHVYDVGTVDEQVFLAVEFIDGETLTSWLRRKDRSWRDVLGVFVAAGRGPMRQASSTATSNPTTCS